MSTKNRFEEKYAGNVEAGWEFLNQFSKGDLVAWPAIEKVISKHRKTNGGQTILKRLRRRMRVERQIVILVETDVGLRLLTDQQAAYEIPQLRQKKARRQINRGLRETGVIDVSMLTPSQAFALNAARKSMKSERLALSRSAREFEALTSPTKSIQAMTR